jgi:4-cresol dehydrogenase (hydroxylating)
MENLARDHTPSLSSTNISQFLDECKRVFPLLRTLSDYESLVYEENTAAYKRSVSGVIFATKTKEVQSIVELANVYKVSLYPISRGRNWGFGSKLPVKENSVILDLSNMNVVREINLDFGYAVVEPGVTQGQLYEMLKKYNAPWFIDVTGSSADSSIMGNALDRGVGYNTLRAEQTGMVEVVTGGGALFQTGFGATRNSSVKHLYKYGIGPSLDGLFAQSNFGVVTAMTINLQPACELYSSFMISFDEERLPLFITRVQTLIRSGVITGIPHIANRERLSPALAAGLDNYFKENKISKSREEIEEIVRQRFSKEWTALGGVFGTKAAVKFRTKEIKKAFRGVAKVIIMTPEKIRLAKKLAKLFRSHTTLGLLSATDAVRGLPLGEPTNSTLASISWPLNLEKGPQKNEPDFDRAGFIYCAPLAPLAADDAVRMAGIARKILIEADFPPALTLNVIHGKLLEAVISMSFDKKNLADVTRAHKTLASLNHSLREAGYYPYRVGINEMEDITDAESPFWQTVKDLKLALDPNNVISPGRYNLI